ncbi:MAG: squalene/phytoene synthase family protein, partial [Alphaproteobacteria bacterium]|nr:squalene/phytoene synthase family protein [Alphaproteobacteria bacterium]
MKIKPNGSKGLYFSSDQVLAQHGKSFYWARFFLGKECSQKATHLYGFCRYLDDIADGHDKDRLDKLLQIKNNINLGSKSHNLPPQIDSFLKLNGGNRSGILSANDLLEGLISDQNDVLISDEGELIQYSYQVAGT